MGDGMFGRRAESAAPKLPGPELDGPPDSSTIQPVLSLTPEQALRYAQARDSFMLATKVQRDSAHATQKVMNERLNAGDRVAALFYAERLQQLGKALRNAQNKFEDRLSPVLSDAQVKAYRAWRKEQDLAAEAKQREQAGRWREMPFGFDRPFGPTVDEKVVVDDRTLPRPGVGSQAIRVGRTIYISGQVAVDSAGAIVGDDLRTQATRAFANLTSVLAAAGALPSDVVRLTVYVVGWRPEDLAIIHEAGAAYFPGRNPPVTTILGVQTLAREGLLIAVEATAADAGNGFSRPRDEIRAR
jgi:enamine deaminase RidA (YjgF/YER057c/UK114 family)